MTIRLDFLKTAEQDLLEIWQHVFEHYPPSADRLIDRLRIRTRLLEKFPDVGNSPA